MCCACGGGDRNTDSNNDVADSSDDDDTSSGPDYGQNMKHGKGETSTSRYSNSGKVNKVEESVGEEVPECVAVQIKVFFVYLAEQYEECEMLKMEKENGDIEGMFRDECACLNKVPEYKIDEDWNCVSEDLFGMNPLEEWQKCHREMMEKSVAKQLPECDPEHGIEYFKQMAEEHEACEILLIERKNGDIKKALRDHCACLREIPADEVNEEWDCTAHHIFDSNPLTEWQRCQTVTECNTEKSMEYFEHMAENYEECEILMMEKENGDVEGALRDGCACLKKVKEADIDEHWNCEAHDVFGFNPLRAWERCQRSDAMENDVEVGEYCRDHEKASHRYCSWNARNGKCKGEIKTKWCRETCGDCTRETNEETEIADWESTFVMNKELATRAKFVFIGILSAGFTAIALHTYQRYKKLEANLELLENYEEL